MGGVPDMDIVANIKPPNNASNLQLLLMQIIECCLYTTRTAHVKACEQIETCLVVARFMFETLT